jgi:hypothetical protein
LQGGVDLRAIAAKIVECWRDEFETAAKIIDPAAVALSDGGELSCIAATFA